MARILFFRSDAVEVNGEAVDGVHENGKYQMCIGNQLLGIICGCFHNIKVVK